jgi:hypothetical protein
MREDINCSGATGTSQIPFRGTQISGGSCITMAENENFSDFRTTSTACTS